MNHRPKKKRVNKKRPFFIFFLFLLSGDMFGDEGGNLEGNPSSSDPMEFFIFFFCIFWPDLPRSSCVFQVRYKLLDANNPGNYGPRKTWKGRVVVLGGNLNM